MVHTYTVLTFSFYYCRHNLDFAETLLGVAMSRLEITDFKYSGQEGWTTHIIHLLCSLSLSWPNIWTAKLENIIFPTTVQTMMYDEVI